jgi:PBP1b-binding outer membrane lipoprotein LpoB
MKSNLYLLITALFLVSCDQQEVATQQVQPSTESVVATTTIAAQ